MFKNKQFFQEVYWEKFSLNSYNHVFLVTYRTRPANFNAEAINALSSQSKEY